MADYIFIMTIKIYIIIKILSDFQNVKNDCNSTKEIFFYHFCLEQDEDLKGYHWLTLLTLASGCFAICFIVFLTVVCIFR